MLLITDTPETPVFLNTLGRQLEPHTIERHWHQSLRALGIRVRGMYAMKDTYVSSVLPLKPIPWIEAQTGVGYSTLKRHYGKWLRQREPDAATAEMDRIAAMEGHFVPPRRGVRDQTRKSSAKSEPEKWRRGESNPRPKAVHGGVYVCTWCFDLAAAAPTRRIRRGQPAVFSASSPPARSEAQPEVRRLSRPYGRRPVRRWLRLGSQ